MIKPITFYAALGFVFSTLSPSFSAECGLTEIATHTDKNKTKVYASAKGIASLYYKANMDVNTDGAPKSYHPDDPRGQKLAYNNIANAIARIFDASGKDVTCWPRRGDCYARFIKTFEGARDGRYNPKGHPRITTDGMIPWSREPALGWNVPCVNQSGKFNGYFISQTSISVDPTKHICDQERYLDSFTFNAVVLPKNTKWIAQGVVTDDGDLVVVRDVENGRIAYAINGDKGPNEGIGEGTIALTSELSGVKLSGKETYAEIRKLVRPKVQYVTFPKDDIRQIVGKSYTQADIDRVGKKLFEEWGGLERLNACTALK